MDNFAVYKTKIGYFKIGYCGNYIISLGITENKDNNFGNPSKLTDKLAVQLDEYFNGKRKKFDVPIFPQGSSFQKKVWEQLRLIDYGDTASYKDIAIRIGNPKACRAVGMANNKNPIMIIIPCHRVIGTNGNLTGYAGGLQLKKYLLDLENQYKNEDSYG